jgi:PAS domain-containing protein
VEDTTDNPITIKVDEDNLIDTFAYLNELIDKRKKVEKELKNSQSHLSAAAKRLSQLITNLNNGILLEDENRNVVLTNRLFCDMFDIPGRPEEIEGTNQVTSLHQYAHLFRHPAKFTEGIEKALKNKKLVTGEELVMNDGRVLLRDYVPVFVANEYKGHLWKYTDVTQRKGEGK